MRGEENHLQARLRLIEDSSISMRTCWRNIGVGFWLMMRCCSLRSWIQLFLRDYDRLQHSAVIFIYIQIGCALVGSLGAFSNGVLLINLAIALFALVAIESSSQSLGRTYAVLLACAILLDISWFILFFSEIWRMSLNNYSTFVLFSMRLTLSMQIIGFCVRFFSSLFWIQMYRLGVSNGDSTLSGDANFYLRNSFLNPDTPDATRLPSEGDDVVGGTIYDPLYYSSLFEAGEDNEQSYRDDNDAIKHEEV